MTPVSAKKTMGKFSMKMPNWFVEASPSEQKRIVEKIKNKSLDNLQELTDDELKNIMLFSSKSGKSRRRRPY